MAPKSITKSKTEKSIKKIEKFKEINPDYDTRYSTAQNTSARDNKNLQIKEYGDELKKVHEARMKTGNFDTNETRMTKEQFYQPFNDYYESEAERMSSPSELSLVHRGWNKIRRRKDEPVTTKQLQTSKNLATRNVLDFLVNPVEILLFL